MADVFRTSLTESEHGFSFVVSDTVTEERIGSGGPYQHKEFAIQEASRMRDEAMERRAPAPPAPLYNPHMDPNYIEERKFQAKYYGSEPQSIDRGGPELDFGPSMGWSR